MFYSSSIYVNSGFGFGGFGYSRYGYMPFYTYSNPFANPFFCRPIFPSYCCYPMYGGSSAFAGAFAGAALGSAIGGLLA